MLNDRGSYDNLTSMKHFCRIFNQKRDKIILRRNETVNLESCHGAIKLFSEEMKRSIWSPVRYPAETFFEKR